MISIFIPSDEINNMQIWVKNIVLQCFNKKTLSNELTVFTFFDDSYKIGDSDLVRKFWNIQKLNEGFFEDILKTYDFQIDRLKELSGEEYETGEFMGYFGFLLADIFYSYLKKQDKIIMHISCDDEMYEL